MFNFFNKYKKTIIRVLAILLALLMIIPTVLSMIPNLF